MTIGKSVLVTVIAASIILMGLAITGFVIQNTATISRIPNTSCTEDMWCWNCKTMGNHICN